MKVLQEGPLANLLNRLMDLILLNVLWFVCCLPVFTIGAATCGLYEVTMRYALYESPPVMSTFFQAFRKHFKNATHLTFLFLAMGIFLAADLWCAFQWKSSIQFLIFVVILAVGYFYLALLSHVFPVLTYFPIGVKESVKKAFFLSMSNGIFTIFIMVLNLIPVFFILLFHVYFGQILFFYFIVGFSVIAYLSSLHLIRLFDPVRAKEAEELEEEQRRLRGQK